MSLTVDQPKAAVERLDRARRILVTGHRSPDGDCLGAALALAELAGKLDVEAVIVNRDEAPAGLRELAGADRVIVADQLPTDFPASYDLVCTVECPGLDRTGFDGLHRLPILNIDHHPANEAYGEVNYLDEDAPAAGEMVWRMFVASPVEPSAAAATAMYAALATDTGDFCYSNATPRAFRAAAEMVEWGARPDVVADLVHMRKSESSIRLLGSALDTLELRAGGRIASVSLAAESFARAGAGPEDTDGIVNLPRAIAGVAIAILFKQTEAGTVRVSLRSKGAIDVRSVAASFGGGGHTNAAGCTIDGDLDGARRKVLAAVEALLETAS
jgi:phosphoesterase RecJ-like protein